MAVHTWGGADDPEGRAYLPGAMLGFVVAGLVGLVLGLAMALRDKAGRGLTACALVPPLLGALGTVAVLLKGRPRSSEATQNVGSLFRGAVAYFEREHRSLDGGLLEPRFPESGKAQRRLSGG